jgi:hypothetical protein
MSIDVVYEQSIVSSKRSTTLWKEVPLEWHERDCLLWR